MDVDANGQPLNSRYNRARRADRDVAEFLGLAKGLLADGIVSAHEAAVVAQWIAAHPDAAEQWPISVLAARVERIFQDGAVDDDERVELAEILSEIVGGTGGVIAGDDAATSLPLDSPPPTLVWSGAVLVFTGKFAFGSRAECQRHAALLGASCEGAVTRRTTHLVIGTFGSRDWVQTSFGRKIEKAVESRATTGRPLIIGEDHWADCIMRAG
jgi:NAD-dependent DNA ligase